MKPRLTRIVVALLLVLVLLIAAIPAFSESQTQASSPSVASEIKEVYRVTLITGDVVTVITQSDGKRDFAISPADPSQLGQHFLTVNQNGDTYIFPDSVDLNKLDRELFNIDYLINEEYYQLPSLPLLISYAPSLPDSGAKALEDNIITLGQETQWLKEVASFSTRLPYDRISTTGKSLLNQSEIAKIWLDKKAHAQLANSVPLIGAPAFWDASYTGKGVKIAILDTGIDATHPDLDDLDDNPTTNDPKVIANVNFSDDPDFRDMHGHGTHVAGTAAGTGSVPGFWNLFGTEPITASTATDWDSAWSPDGSKIAFTSDRDGTRDIFLYNIATKNTTKLLELNSNEDTPAWSPDSTKLIFERQSSVAEENGIWLVSGNGTHLARVYEAGHQPTWRPDGNEIAFEFNDDIWAISTNGTGMRQITSETAKDWHAAWSPDGSKIAFTSNRTGIWGIWTVDAIGTESSPTKIADSTESGEPAWSADGAWLAFEAPPPPWSKYNRISAVNMNGSSSYQRIVLVTPVYQSADPSWSLDGNKLAFTSWQTGSADIYITSKPETGLKGVAPGAWLWNVKVLDQYGSGYESEIINGINFASLGLDGLPQTGDEADIISMSLGGSWQTDGTDPMSKAVNLAVDRGVVVVVAAGNSGSSPFTVATPGVAEKVITVGASDKTDQLASFSSRGPTIDYRVKPDILAPGVSIISTLPRTVDGPTYGSKSGTSMATPHVAGAAALFLEGIQGRPILPGLTKPQVVKDVLMSTAKDLGYNVYEQGSGRLDLDNLLSVRTMVTPASLSLGKFTSENISASSMLTFISDNASANVTLTAELIDILNSDNYSANVALGSNVAHGTLIWKTNLGEAGLSGGGVWGTRISGDGKFIAARTQSNLHFFERDNPTPLWSFNAGQINNADIPISRDGKYTVAYSGNKVYLLQNSSNITAQTYDIGSTVNSVSLSEYGDRIAAGATSGIYLFSNNSSVPIWSYSTPARAWPVRLSSDGKRLVASDDTNTIYVFNTENVTPSLLWTKAVSQKVGDLSISGDGSYIAALTGDAWNAATAFLFNISSSTPVWTYAVTSAHLYGDAFEHIAISEDGNYIGLGSIDGKFHLFNNSSGTPLWSYQHNRRTYDIGMTPDGSTIAIIAVGTPGDSDVVLFSNSGNTPLWSYRSPGDDFQTVSISQDGKYIAAGHWQGDEYLFSNSISPNSFILPAHSTANVTLNIDLTSLPASIYSGKIFATINGTQEIHAIFGFTKVRKVTVNKTNINGQPAQGHIVWVFQDNPIIDISTDGVTDGAGNMTFYAFEGTYQLISPNWKYEQNDTTIWTIAENVAVSNDIVINMDERQTKVIDFNPDKTGQIPSRKASILYFVSPNFYGGWGSDWWYPSSFVTRVSLTYRFNAGFLYNLYPQVDFNPTDPELVNTSEWYNLLYSTQNITENTTFVADYGNLAHRNASYNVALKGEKAYWYQNARDDISFWSLGFGYAMSAPQQRWEWLSPQPVRYSQYYRRYYEAKENSWGFYSPYSMTYPPGEYNWGIGSHPLTSGFNLWINWNVAPPSPTPTPTTPPPTPTATPTPTPPATTPAPTTPAPPPGGGGGGGSTINYLYVGGPISKDANDNFFENRYTSLWTGHIRVTANSDNVLYDRDIYDSFSSQVYFVGTPRLTVEVWGKKPLALSTNSYTRLDFTANSSHEYYPPRLRLMVPGISTSGIVQAGEVKVNVQAIDESLINTVGLKYSTNNGTTWQNASLHDFQAGYYIFSLGQLQDKTVRLAIDAEDTFGNHTLYDVNPAFVTSTGEGGGGTEVRVNAPAGVVATGNFTATIDINGVENFDSTNYNISFDNTMLSLDNITSGQIGLTEIPVDYWNQTSSGNYSIVQNIPGLTGVSGSGYLAKLHFHVNGILGQSSNIVLSEGTLSDNASAAIPATWTGDVVRVVPNGDANGDGTVNSQDITKVERIIVHYDPPTPGADANLDGIIDSVDVTKVERIIVHLD